MRDWFDLVWIGMFAFIAYWNAAWFWRAHKTGVATVYTRFEVSRVEKPFEFRMIQIGRIVSIIAILAALTFVFTVKFRM